VALKKALYEHLKTFKKYNTLALRYEMKCEEYDKRVNELNTQKKIRQIEKAKWEETLQEYVSEIATLKEEIAKLKVEKRKKKEN
jgi:hypothetical protein